MPDTEIEPDRSLYQARRRVEALRRQVFNQADPAAAQDLAADLLAAEAALHRLEIAAGPPAPDPHAVLLDTQGTEDKPGGILMGPDTEVAVRVVLHMSHVPTSIAHLLDPKQTPLVAFELTNSGGDSVRLRLISFIEGYSARAIDTVKLAAGQSTRIPHLPTFFPGPARHLAELTRATLHIRIDDLDGAVQQHSTFPIWLLARTTAYRGVKDPSTGKWLDLTRYFGAWVTPNAPEVLRVLRCAADLHPQRTIAGYQDDEASVRTQVQAVYDALKAERIVYVNSILSFGADPEHAVQRIRLPRESIAGHSANCIDGAVLFASVLEAASLNPALVLVPGHAFLGWEGWDGSGRWHYLETTLIGSGTFEAACAAGESLAARYGELAQRTGNPRHFQRLALPELRTRLGVTPME